MASGEPECARWRAQRWLVDNIIKSNGVEFDQGRLSIIQSLAGAEVGPEIAMLKSRMQKFDDIAPLLEAQARRREKIAGALEAEGERVSASENYYVAAHYWAVAQWPILVNNDLNRFYNDRKRDCYTRYARLADHSIEAVWIPFQGKKLPAWLHLPPGYKGGKLPAVVVISGMDGYKERDQPLYGDRWMRRGMAVLTVDGPGQYEAAVMGIPVTTPAWLEAGPAIYEWLAARPEIDPERIGISGRSFGSFFVTLAMAGEPRFRAGVVSGTIHEPGCHTIFGEAPPTFKRRFMYMAGYRDEAAFDEFAKSLTWEGHAEKIRAPYLCVTGEFDALSPLQHTEALFRALAGPKVLVVYQGCGHAISGATSANLGPYFPTLMADWLSARLAGKGVTSERWTVEASGHVAKAFF
jgi:dienelactone hydrolase